MSSTSRGPFGTACGARLVVERRQVGGRQLIELVLVEAWEAWSRGSRVRRSAMSASRVGVEAGLTNRQQEIFRLEPAASVDDHVVGATESESTMKPSTSPRYSPVGLSTFMPSKSIRLIVKVASVDIRQPGSG